MATFSTPPEEDLLYETQALMEKYQLSIIDLVKVLGTVLHYYLEQLTNEQ